MKKIVITGGPSAGKTTILQYIAKNLKDTTLIVPEAATQLFQEGYPQPKNESPWTKDWQTAFQREVFARQVELERDYLTRAKKQQKSLVIFDRGILDGAAYWPKGKVDFLKEFFLDETEVLSHYEYIIHLQSLAISHQHNYGNDNNRYRFEATEQAQLLEKRTLDAWKNHPNRTVIRGTESLRTKTDFVLQLITGL